MLLPTITMESKMFLIVLNIAIFSCLTQSGIALNCYQCESKVDDDSCTYGARLNMSGIEPQECVANTTLSESGLSPICLKLFTASGPRCTDHHVVRKCIWIKETEDPCASAAILLPYFSNLTIAQTCTVCKDKDGCNVASPLKFLSTFLFFGTMLSAFSIL